ncbi:MAG: hypothetical protein AAF513_00670 [Pseudomonadota bacterium]
MAAVSGAADWRRYEADEITLVADLPAAKARALLQRLRAFDQVMDAYVPRDGFAAPPLRIVVFAQRREFARIYRSRHFAAFTQPRLSRTTLVVGPDGPDGWLQNLLHEHVHYRLRTASRSVPLWYEEGLATLLSTTRFEREEGVEVASAPLAMPEKYLRRPIANFDLPAMTAVTRLDDWPLGRITSFYKRSAHLTRYLLQDKPGVAAALDRHLETREQPIWRELGLSPDDLQRAVTAYNKAADWRVRRFELEPVPAAGVRESKLSRDEVDRLLAATALTPNPRYAARTYQRLLKRAPEDAGLWASLAAGQRRFDRAAARRSLERAQQLDPQHPEVLLETAVQAMDACPLDRSMQCLVDWQDVTHILREVLAQNPDHYHAILWLGVTELYSGNPGGALNYLKVAQARAPWAPRVNYLLGEALRLLGNPRCRAYLERARNWAHDARLRGYAEASLGLLP